MTGAKIRNATIGDHFIACENCVIGTSGFTMAEDAHGEKMRIPTLGNIVIGNYVEIGALSSVSVGADNSTVIEDYVKVDTHVHISHDDIIRRNGELTSGTILGGYNEIGRNTFFGLNASTRNRLSLGDNALIGMGAVVVKSVEADTTVIGNPAKPMKGK